MAMDTIKVSTSEMRNTATNIKTQAQNFRDHAAETYNEANNLHSEWEGDASEEFLQRMTDMKKIMDNLSDILDKFPIALNEGAETYETADTASANAFK